MFQLRTRHMKYLADDNNPTRPTSHRGSEARLGGRQRNSDQFRPDDVIADRYKVLSVVGRGGYGCVYRVWHLHIRKEFALKTLNPMTMSDVTAMRLQKEAQAAARLDHPNLVRAFDFGLIEDTQPFLVMEFVEGPTLHQFLREHGRMSVQMALAIFIPLAEALAFAHSLGVVHRDLKPSNVILARGEHGANTFTPKIVDFGIAKIQFSDENMASLTSTGDVFGTPLYMSPEQCAGTAIDERTDIYALGCMLFEVLTGAPPFNGRNPLEIMMQHGSAACPSLKEASLGERFPTALERVVAKMLVKEKQHRYASCHLVAEDLGRIQRGEDEGVARTTIATTIAPADKRRASVLQLAIAGSISLILGITVGYGVGLCRAPAPIAPAVMPTSHDLVGGNGTNALSFNDASVYYSKTDDYSHTRTFKFDSKRRIQLGFLDWWKDGKFFHQPTKGTVSTPSDSKLIFEADFECLIYPPTLASFHPDELDGVILLRHTCSVNEEQLNQSISMITQQNNLKLLTMEDKNLTSTTLRRIGEVRDLRWLELSETCVDDRPLSGKEVSWLSNLHNLRVVKIDGAVDMHPMLEKLVQKNSLKRLSLRDTNLDTNDCSLIGKLQSLEVLSITGKQRIEPDKLIEMVLELPKLKHFGIEGKLLRNCKPELLEKLNKKLTVNVYDKKSGENLKMAQKARPGAILEEADQDLWFNPTNEDPAAIGVW